MALGLQQGVRPAVHHHGGGCHSDDGHAVPDACLEAVVPLVVGHGEQTCVGRARRGEARIRGGADRTKKRWREGRGQMD